MDQEEERCIPSLLKTGWGREKQANLQFFSPSSNLALYVHSVSPWFGFGLIDRVFFSLFQRDIDISPSLIKFHYPFWNSAKNGLRVDVDVYRARVVSSSYSSTSTIMQARNYGKDYDNLERGNTWSKAIEDETWRRMATATRRTTTRRLNSRNLNVREHTATKKDETENQLIVSWDVYHLVENVYMQTGEWEYY